MLIVGEPGWANRALSRSFTRGLRHAAHLGRVDLLTTSAEHATASSRRMGSSTFRWRRCPLGAAPCGFGKLPGAGEARFGRERPAAGGTPRYSAAPGRAPALAAEELRRRQLAALTNWVIAGAKVQPAVLVFEDLQWADPTTLDVLRALAERGAQVPLFVLATARPEFRAPWSMRSHHGTVSLAPLDRSQVRDMVAELSARHALPRDVVDDVAARTGGVPLFIEEVTRLLLERGEQGGIQAIPPTLQQSLMARLDRLGPAREVAQIGSVIGRGFSYALLRAVTGMDDAALQVALERLADADILLVQGSPPEAIIGLSTRSFRMQLTRICSRAAARPCIGA